MKKKLPIGFVPVMITPFNNDLTIDFEGVARLTEMYITAGAAGLFANCLSSEMYELTDIERLQLVETVVRTTQGRVPIVATGTLGGSIEEMADFSKKLYATGIDAVIVINSILANEEETDEVFLERMAEFMALTENIPLGIYECPVPYKRLINSHILSSLLPSNRLIYHKDTSLNIESVKERISIGRDYNFGLYDAYMVNAVASLRAGALGLSCIQGNYFPALVVWLCKHFNDVSQVQNIEKVQQFFTDNMDIMHAAYPISAKYVLQQRDFDISLATRREVGELTADIKKALDQLLKDYQTLSHLLS
jgi:4-hydroxy-tetrahydrodipicolinate synthase